MRFVETLIKFVVTFIGLSLLIGTASYASDRYTTMTILRHNPGVNGAQLDDFVRHVHPESPLLPENNGGTSVGQLWVNAGLRNNIDPVYLMAHAMVESAWGTDQIAPYNIYGYGAYDSDPNGGAYHFTSYADCIDKVSAWILEDYLSPSGGWYTQYGPTLRGMNVYYATGQSWRDSICSIMNWFAGGNSGYGWPGFAGYTYPSTFGDFDANYKLLDTHTDGSAFSDADPYVMHAGGVYSIPLKITNTGPATWLPSGANPIRVAYHWKQGSKFLASYSVVNVPGSIASGQSFRTVINVTTSATAGVYTLAIDMARMNDNWFTNKYISTLDIPVEVNAPAYRVRGAVGAVGNELASYAGGQMAAAPGTILQAGGAAVYVADTTSGTPSVYSFSSADVFNTLGFKWSDIVHVSDADIAVYTNRGSISGTAVHRNGQLVKGSAAGIYLLDNGAKRPVTYSAFIANGYRWDRVITVTNDELSAYPLGTTSLARPGTLIKGSGQTVYISDRIGDTYYKRAFSSAAVFTFFGLKWTDVMSIPDSELNQYAATDPVTTGSTRPNGQLVSGGGSYYIKMNNIWMRLPGYLYRSDYQASFPPSPALSVADMTKSKAVGLSLNFSNNGSIIWRGGSATIIYAWQNADTGALVAAGTGGVLGSDVGPGSSGVAEVIATTLAQSGLYVLKWSVGQAPVTDSSDSGGAAGFCVVRVHPAYPGGTLVKQFGSGSVYLLSGTTRQPISYAAFITNKFKWENIRTMAASEIGECTVAPPVSLRTGSLVKGSGATVYIIDDSARRIITSAAAFDALGLKWQDIVVIPDAELASYTISPSNLSNAAVHPNGMLVKGSAPGVFLLLNGQKRPVSLAAFTANAFRWDRVVTISDSELAGYAYGAPALMPSGTLIKNASAAIYVVEGGAKRPIGSAAVFESLGYRWGDIMTVPDSDLAQYSTGSALQ